MKMEREAEVTDCNGISDCIGQLFLGCTCLLMCRLVCVHSILFRDGKRERERQERRGEEGMGWKVQVDVGLTAATMQWCEMKSKAGQY
jgi:hypothetical protein